VSKKILVIRFSAMGDVILTSPVIRCIKQTYPDCVLHFVVKAKFAETVNDNPYIDRIHTFENHPREILAQLKAENFDFVADLQRNRKSSWLRRKLHAVSGTFPKLNFRKLLLTRLKIDLLPKIHVVDRYFKAVEKLGVHNDQKGLDFFIRPAETIFNGNLPLNASYVVLVLGATYFTKRIPQLKLEEIISNLEMPVVLLGGPAERSLSDELTKKFPQVKNMVGETTLAQAAVYIKNAQYVITSDTGLMHIAAAFRKRIIAVWGNTVPAFGMGPYMPQEPGNAVSFEVKGLSCRPCSKLGYDHCPKKHFRCMLDHDGKAIASMVEKGF
jgi:ADP-heptose:LPS heptosyltransferase